MDVRKPTVALHFRQRADGLFSAARDLEEFEGYASESYWPAIGILAVHGCIALSDAALVAAEGEPGGGQDHGDAARRLKAWCAARSVASSGIAHFEWLLAKKNHFSYNARTVRDDELHTAKVKMDQFFAWTFQAFPELAQLTESADA